MRVLVTGSRTWTDEPTIVKALEAVAFGAADAGYKRLVVVHGACPHGADAIADMWVRGWTLDDITVTAERHPALWELHGKRAGFIRNQEMVESGIDLALAFIRDNSRGATQCAELASDAGVPMRVFHFGEQGVVAIGGEPG